MDHYNPQNQYINTRESLRDLVDNINNSSFLQIGRININNNGQFIEDSIENKGNLQAQNGTINWSEKRQAVVFARLTENGGVMLKVTAKAAGFVLGPHGRSIRAICSKTGSQSKSWLCGGANTTLLRAFAIQGSDSAIIETIHIIQAAVKRYSDLVSGNSQDRRVLSEQMIEGIMFEYKPPPLTIMSTAARTVKPQQQNDARNLLDSGPPQTIQFPTALQFPSSSQLAADYPFQPPPYPQQYFHNHYVSSPSPSPAPAPAPSLYPQISPLLQNQGYQSAVQGTHPYKLEQGQTFRSPRGVVPQVPQQYMPYRTGFYPNMGYSVRESRQ